MSIAFLEDALISKQTITPGNFKIYEPESKSTSCVQYMVLDSQALQHLEIIEAADGKVEGSLLNYVDHCSTSFGRRQIKRWVMAPLIITEQINERLDAVTDLMSFQHETDVLRARLKKLPDLEKLLARIFSYSIKHSVKAIYFEDVTVQKMRDFRTLLNSFKEMPALIEPLTNIAAKLNSSRLKVLCTLDTEGGLLPSGLN